MVYGIHEKTHCSGFEGVGPQLMTAAVSGMLLVEKSVEERSFDPFPSSSMETRKGCSQGSLHTLFEMRMSS